MLRSARAFAPGSVTTVFVPATDPDGGSLGVSVAVADGVAATVRPANETTVSLDGRETAFDPVERALAALDLTATVDLEATVPVGRGFGASGAATLATALAADEVFDLGRSRAALVDVAHRAEVAAGTGLGDVFVQARGGLVWNAGDGIRRAESDADLSYTSYGGIATEEVLGDDDALDRVRVAGRDALAALDPHGPVDALVERSWRFARETGLVTDRVERAVSRVERAGGVGTMAMVGETVVAVGAGDALASTTRATNEGARLR
ncbi:GHMP family kinase ATP-binding protein [Halomarina ordinaria]|uniref:Pantoate kinase n=1 Tax=Halomarina ordinaria TaxID=3033939 RepID=A0ABD5UB35_9EURY|nr:GHMP kinase [Halomarina sp. PSRA2]